MRTYLDFMDGLERGEFAPVYLFHGEEEYLRKQALQELKRHILASESAQFNFDPVDGEETTAGTVVSLAEAPPFLAGRRLVVVRHAPYFTTRVKEKPSLRTVHSAAEDTEDGLTSAGDASLLRYLDHPLSTTCLVFDTGQDVDQRRKLYKAVRRAGRVIEFACLKPDGLARWLTARANQAGKKMAFGSADLLIGRAGRSMTLLANELQKVISYAGEKDTITTEDVREVTVPRIQENIFTVVDAVGERRAGRALSGIQELLAANHSAPVILSMIARQFRLILQAQELAAAGCQFAELSKLLEVPPFVARKILAQSRNFSFEQVKQVMKQLLELDADIKTGNRDFYPAMEMLVLELCISPLA